jgi:hypothetical protein
MHGTPLGLNLQICKVSSEITCMLMLTLNEIAATGCKSAFTAKVNSSTEALELAAAKTSSRRSENGSPNHLSPAEESKLRPSY